MTDTNEAAWWRRTRAMAAATLAAMALATAAPFLLGDNPDRTIFNLPLRSFLISLAVPAALVVAIFLFAAQQDGLDRRYDVSED